MGEVGGECRHVYPDGTRCSLSDHSPPGVAAVHGARAAAPDALREAVEALLAELPMDSTGHVVACGYSDETLGGCDCYTLPTRLRAVLAERPLGYIATWRGAQDFAMRHALEHETNRCTTCLHLPSGRVPSTPKEYA